MRNYVNELWQLMGPAFLVSVAYLDPGNWATAIESGSQFGYTLVWVILLSSLIAILLQTLAARLGLVTGKHLAQICREAYPPTVCYTLWFLCEISIVALDLTMVLGTAIGLNLLFKLPVLPCILLTALDGVILMAVVPKLGVRKSELITVGLVCCVLICFIIDLFLSKPQINELTKGFFPSLPHDALSAAVSLLGANVMPHNFFLHSALVSGKRFRKRVIQNQSSLKDLCHYNFVDVSVALGAALIVNIAVLIVAAATFNQKNITITTLQQAHDMMEQLLSSSAAPKAFGLALLCTGQLSTFTGTIAGQITTKGFLNLDMSTWLRRLVTRTSAILPAAVTYFYYGDWGCYRLLVIAQIVLALQLPFTLIPLIKSTSSRKLMGPFANTFFIQILCWGSTVLIFLANLLLLVDQFSHQPQVQLQNIQTEEKISENFVPLGQWLQDMTVLAYQDTWYFFGLCLIMLFSSIFLLLLVWMLVTPLQCTREIKDLVSMKLFQQDFCQTDIEEQADKNVSTVFSEFDEEQQNVFFSIPIVDQFFNKVLNFFLINQQIPKQLDFSIIDWDKLEQQYDQEQQQMLLLEGGENIMGQEENQEKNNNNNNNNFQCSSHQSGLSRGDRKKLAIALDQFWAIFYDRHGQHVGCSFQEHTQQHQNILNNQQYKQLQPRNLNITPFPFCCSLVQNQSQNQNQPEWNLLKLQKLQQKQCITEEIIIESVKQCMLELQGNFGGTILSGQIGVHQQVINTLNIHEYDPQNSDVKNLLNIAWSYQFDEKLSLFSQPPHSVLSASKNSGTFLSQIGQLFFSFGFVCIGFLLNLCEMEPRPDLWGRYASVLNRLQFLLVDARFVRLNQCKIDFDDLSIEILNMVKECEKSLQSKKGPKGTGAGNVAFPKGKEILGSVLKRYKKYLSNVTKI